MNTRVLCSGAALAIVSIIPLAGCHLDEIVPLSKSSETPAEISMELFEPFEGNHRFVLSERIGNPIVVNFWASWCGPCRTEIPLLEDAWVNHRQKGLLIVGIATQDSEQGAKELAEELKVSYPIGLDFNGSMAMKHRITGLPTTLFITRDGSLFKRWVGTIDAQTLERHLIELMSS